MTAAHGRTCAETGGKHEEEGAAEKSCNGPNTSPFLISSTLLRGGREGRGRQVGNEGVKFSLGKMGEGGLVFVFVSHLSTLFYLAIN